VGAWVHLYSRVAVLEALFRNHISEHKSKSTKGPVDEA
jgi:hypothetical protein